VDLIVFPLTGVPLGTLAGLLIGAGGGAAAGPVIDRPPARPAVLTQGEARDYLIENRKDHPELDLRTIVDATNLLRKIQLLCIYVSEWME